MENHNRPAGDVPQDEQPTEQFWPGQGAPAGEHGFGQQPPAHDARGRRKPLRWTVGIMVAALLAGGGAIAGVALASPALPGIPAASSSPATAGGQGGGAAATPGSQAALLNSALTAADSPAATGSPAGVTGLTSAGQPGTGTAVGRCARALAAARAARLAGHPRPAGVAARFALRCHVRHRVIRFFLLHGVDGQFTFRTSTGALKTLAYQRGVVESLNGSTSIVVKAADGTIWTWQLVSNTVVREATGKVSESALADGADVWVGGPVINGSKDARLIFIRPPGGTS